VSDPTMSESMTLRSFGYEQELKRSLSLADLMTYGLIFGARTALSLED
jgi:hypothetical protein